MTFPTVSSRRKWAILLAAVLLVVCMCAGYLVYHSYASSAGRTARVLEWLHSPADHPDWALQSGERCDQAPFIFPTNGFVGYLWDDSFKIGHRHQGIDIFGGTDVGLTPIVAAYPGYLTRLSNWKSSLIIRIPNDPLHPGRTIWTYYTHMADPEGHSLIVTDFPAGVSDIYVPGGILLGYQGNYSGDPASPVGVHLHFSIVLDDGQGKFRNELDIHNTLDPSPYLGLALNANQNHGEVPTCIR